MTAFEYEKDGIRMWRSWEVGKEEEHEEEEDEDAQCVSKKEKKCVKRPKLESNLEQHLDVGRHLRRPERMNIQDISLNRYASFLEIVAPPKVCHVIDEAIGSLFDDTNAMESPLPMGWALSERKKSERFPDSVKSFLKKLYDEGERTGAMRHANTSNGDMLFKVEHLLNCRQIAGDYAGFNRTKLNKIAKAKASGSRGKRDAHPEPEPDEVNDLLANDQYEGDPELEYETEPLFDVTDLMRIALTREHNNLWSKEGEKGGTEDGKGEAIEE
ncbi:hypothetical protein PRIPAC_78498 [Pristionchus pacificus]|uniref:Uncharacterized protein n=1 Tax=Pristionchus pacificus TaxID=54126 RepID=A0A2A6CKW3_PRIPA|nr:hypothetical protein PRIPAC_78498 [Pristionchus pacificus]|eukprot:PDM78717.1 hypothetical protein PRIPAC_31296 [Pristionchus pacificus]